MVLLTSPKSKRNFAYFKPAFTESVCGILILDDILEHYVLECLCLASNFRLKNILKGDIWVLKLGNEPKNVSVLNFYIVLCKGRYVVLFNVLMILYFQERSQTTKEYLQFLLSNR